MRLLSSALRIVLVLAAEAAAVVLLLRLGSAGWARVDWGDPLGWLATAPPVDAVVAVLRVVALAGASWLAASTALAVAVRLTRVPAAIRAADMVTLPTVRRLADRAVAVALTTGTLVTPAGIAVAAPAPVVQAAEAAREDAAAGVDTAGGRAAGGAAGGADAVGDGAAGPAGPSGPPRPPGTSWSPGSAVLGGAPIAIPVAWPGLPPVPPPAPPGPPSDTGGGPSSAPAPAAPGSAGPTPAASAGGADAGTPAPAAPVDHAARAPGLPAVPAPEPGPQAVAVGQVVHVVVAGDSLWELARVRVAATLGLDPVVVADRDVHAYWVRVLDANRDRIPSSDPDLIRPGDRVVLPATA